MNYFTYNESNLIKLCTNELILMEGKKVFYMIDINLILFD